ncbi:helicase associated domain-containing protein [Streptomyces sp. NWU339]|uniref:helicase associated domain-containing protein n=1 Tax=Streptomyces sp. NWU339 TaxID=2185284 RepID=UPI002812064B|nr:helicase associated domain-containing protein [Streptomyces sp. NWU339]
MAREGKVVVGRAHVEELPDGTMIKLGVFLSNQKARRDRLDAQQRAALAELGYAWAAEAKAWMSARRQAEGPHTDGTGGGPTELRGRAAVLRARGAPRVLRKRVERIVVGGDRGGGNGQDQEVRELKLGPWIGNQRSRAATLTPERMEQLSAIGRRWRRAGACQRRRCTHSHTPATTARPTRKLQSVTARWGPAVKANEVMNTLCPDELLPFDDGRGTGAPRPGPATETVVPGRPSPRGAGSCRRDSVRLPDGWPFRNSPALEVR